MISHISLHYHKGDFLKISIKEVQQQIKDNMGNLDEWSNGAEGEKGKEGQAVVPKPWSEEEQPHSGVIEAGGWWCSPN